ncbi:MAG: hypothetical protein HYY13_12835 [Nitrospirae bacterium]|nr:hypothetical protein [Nitrospirota bacterium]
MSLALLVFHIKQSPTEHVTTAGMAVGVALGGLFGLAYNRYLRRGIRQNEYIRPPRTDLLKQGIILIPTMLIFWHFLPQLVDDSKVWNRFFVFPFFLLLPVGMLYNVLWLNEYERKVGPVVIRKHRR